MLVTPAGITMLARELQPSKANPLMLVKSPFKVTSRSSVQPPNPLTSPLPLKTSVCNLDLSKFILWSVLYSAQTMAQLEKSKYGTSISAGIFMEVTELQYANALEPTTKYGDASNSVIVFS